MLSLANIKLKGRRRLTRKHYEAATDVVLLYRIKINGRQWLFLVIWKPNGMLHVCIEPDMSNGAGGTLMTQLLFLLKSLCHGLQVEAFGGFTNIHAL